MELVDYRSNDDANERWREFRFREGDIVVSTRSKHGTTWIQWICAMLVHGTTKLPRPLAELSPWLDHLVEPLDVVLARLDAQSHRRIIKTHTPLDGIPIDARATYVVVARHPLDAAVSLYHHSANIDRSRLAELTGEPQSESLASLLDLGVWLRGWIDDQSSPRESLESPAGVLWHITDAWNRRAEPNIVLVHYHDLTVDLDRSMRELAQRLEIAVDPERLPELVEAARFESMRANFSALVPDRLGVLRDPTQFFRRGSSHAGREILTDAGVARYHQRVAALAPANVLSWVNRP